MHSSASRVSGVALILACLCHTAVASKDDNRHSWSTDYIILLVVGLVLIVVVLACWLWCCCCRRRTTETTTVTEDVAPVVVSSRGGVEPDAGSRLTAVVPGGSEDGNSTVSRKSSKTHQWTTVDEGGNDHEDVAPSVGTEETPIEPLNPLAAPPPAASGKKSSVKLHSTPTTTTTTTTAVSSGNTNATNEVELTSVEAFPQLHMATAATSDGDAQPQPPIVSKEAAPPTAPREVAEAAPPKSRDDAVVAGTSDTTAEASTAGESQKSAASKKSGVKLRSVPTVTSTTKTTTTAVILDASEETVPPPPPTAAQTEVGETAPAAGGDGATSNATPGKKSGVKLRSVPRPAGSNPGDSPPPPPQASV